MLAGNHVNISVPGGASHAEQIRTLAEGANKPLAIAHLDPILDIEKSIRGAVFSADLGRVLNDIAISYRDMIWGLSDDGLFMQVEEPPPNTAGLSNFDKIAGEMYVGRSLNGRLSSADLHAVAAALDDSGETLKGSLQPKQWAAIAFHNQKNARRPVKTFTDAMAHPDFATFVRRRLYVARDAYKQALLLPRGHLEKYDAHLPRNSSIIF